MKTETVSERLKNELDRMEEKYEKLVWYARRTAEDYDTVPGARAMMDELLRGGR